MQHGYITFRSVTYAQRGESLLRRKGFWANMQRTPKWMEEMGCGYCLRVPVGELAQAVVLLREQQVAYRKVYRPNGEGKMEEAL